eukprot:g15720.t1
MAATAAALSERFSGGGPDSVAGGKTSDFWKRRPSVTSTQATPKAESEVSGRHNSTAMYPSLEIGAAPDTVPLPFPDGGRALFSVFDGRGGHGDVVSHFVMHEPESFLAAHPSLLEDPAKALMQSYIKVDESLVAAKGQEATFSGTTAVSVLMRENNLWIANASDSRAVLAKEDGNALKFVDLSVDQNPNSPKEQARIEAIGGFVSPPPEPGLSSRVWLDAAMTQIGLAMARSIGDHAVKSFGVVAEPEVTTHAIEGKDKKFIVLASDGVWEFISSQEAVDIVGRSLEEGTMKRRKT